VLRNGLLADVEVRGDLVHRARLIAHEQQHRASAGLGQSRERGFVRHANQDMCAISEQSSLNLYKQILVYLKCRQLKGGNVGSRQTRRKRR
jgi:hypothetical protein